MHHLLSLCFWQIELKEKDPFKYVMDLRVVRGSG